MLERLVSSLDFDPDLSKNQENRPYKINYPLPLSLLFEILIKHLVWFFLLLLSFIIWFFLQLPIWLNSISKIRNSYRH